MKHPADDLLDERGVVLIGSAALAGIDIPRSSQRSRRGLDRLSYVHPIGCARSILKHGSVVRGGCEYRGVTAALCEPAQALSAGLEGVRGSLRGLDDKALLQAQREVEMLSRKAQSVMLDLVAEIDSRGIAGREGFGPTPRLLAGMLHLSAAEARMRVEHAGMVGTRRTLTGQILEPQLPATAAALAAGEIGAGQLRVITDTMTLLPDSVPEPARERVEAELAGYARDFRPPPVADHRPPDARRHQPRWFRTHRG